MPEASNDPPPDSKLNFLLIHGIGPQKSISQREFLDKVSNATSAMTMANSTVPSGGGLAGPPAACVLRAVRADWSKIYKEPKETWLEVMFPDRKSGWALLAMIFPAMTIIIGFVLVAYQCFAGACIQPLHPPAGINLPLTVGSMLSFVQVALWKAFLVVVSGGIALWGLTDRFVPWSSIYGLLRGFEARTLSDVMIYCGRKGEMEIVYEVCKCLLKMHPDPREYLKFVEDPDGYHFPKPEDRPRLVLGGHSQGTVIAIDMLCGSSKYLQWQLQGSVDNKRPSMRRRLELLAGILDKEIMLAKFRDLVMIEFDDLQHCETTQTLSFADAKEVYNLTWDEGEYFYYRLLEFLNMSFATVGMVTFGAPVPLFMFRNPDQFPREVPSDHALGLWKVVCPPGFQQTGAWEGITWRWQNFLHADDFVAHRMEALFNAGFHGQFVTDVERNAPVRHPIQAHSSYWTNKQVISDIATQLAETIAEMQRAQQV